MADKLKMETKNLADENYKKLIELFPNIVTETTDEDGNVFRAIDADLLQQEINEKVVEGAQERYVFTWPDKKRFIALGNKATTSTLRLDKEKSVGRDGTPGSIDTGNIYIEGDNLEALKLLRETYLGKIKMIYIDPPYNTGNDSFVYDDDSSMSEEEFEERSGARDEEGNLKYDFKVNNESNGRFHTDWLNMMYPRLTLAKDLLSNDGVIFISIDDNEVENLKKICDEIFGQRNFVGIAVRKTRGSATTKSDAELQSLNDYVVIYFKDKSVSSFNKKNIGSKQYPYEDERGKYYIVPLQDNGPQGTRDARPNLYYPIYLLAEGTLSIDKPGYECEEYLPARHQNKDGRWMWSKDKFRSDYRDLTAIDGKVYIKHYYNPAEDQNRYQREKLWLDDFQNAKGTKELNELFAEKGLFNNPKPVELIKYCLQLATDKDSLVLDFFSGSATTAQAVMQLNAEDGGRRKFILVQLSEICNEYTEAYKAGYKTICDIGEERIRRAGKKIKEGSPLTTGDLDIGFRAYKVDNSNMKPVYYKPNEITQDLLESLAVNIEEGRTGEDLLIQIMLELGVDLSSKIEETEISGKKVFSASGVYLVACFDDDITEDVITQIAKKVPTYAAFRDSGMASDSVMTNYEQIFKTYSPKTIVKVL